MSLGVADCHYNMAVLYKILGRLDRTLEHFTAALKIRRQLIGPLSVPVVNTLE